MGRWNLTANTSLSQICKIILSGTPKTSVSVAHKAEATTVSDTKLVPRTASSTVHETVETIKDAGTSLLANAEPVAEAIAHRVEGFRDTLLAGTSTTHTPSTKSAATSTAGTKAATQEFFATSKTIAKSADLPLWKKAVGVLLTLAAFFARIWFVFLVLLVAFIAWRLVRGVRIW